MRKLCPVLGLLGLAVSLPLFAVTTTTSSGGTGQAMSVVNQAASSYFNNLFNSTNRPDWLTRTDVTYSIKFKSTPITGLETIQPLFQNRWSTLFWQGRVSYNDGDTTGNIGLGYRYLTDSRNLMIGVNTFYDQQFHYSHRRIGVGGEVFTRFVTFRANYYDALSGQRMVGSTNNGLTPFYERALSGYDAGLETPVPFVSWMRFVAEGYHWQGVNNPNINGGAANLRIFPARQLEVDLGIASDNDKGGQAFVTASYYFGSPAFIQNSATSPSYQGPFAPQDLEAQRLQKVIRHNDIVVEKTHGVIATGIIIARGT